MISNYTDTHKYIKTEKHKQTHKAKKMSLKGSKNGRKKWRVKTKTLISQKIDYNKEPKNNNMYN